MLVFMVLALLSGKELGMSLGFPVVALAVRPHSWPVLCL